MILPHKCEELAVYHSQVHQMALWGHQVHLCMHAIHMYGVLCTKCLELAPLGLNSLILCIYIFVLIKHLKLRYKNYIILKFRSESNRGKGLNIYLILIEAALDNLE